MDTHTWSSERFNIIACHKLSGLVTCGLFSVWKNGSFQFADKIFRPRDIRRDLLWGRASTQAQYVAICCTQALSHSSQLCYIFFVFLGLACRRVQLIRNLLPCLEISLHKNLKEGNRNAKMRTLNVAAAMYHKYHKYFLCSCLTHWSCLAQIIIICWERMWKLGSVLSGRLLFSRRLDMFLLASSSDK